MVSGFYLSRRSRRNLIGVNHRLVSVVERAIEITTVDFAVTEGVRDISRQRMLVSQGRSKTLRSKHLIGMAVDVMAVGDLNRDGYTDAQDRSITWDREHYHAIADAFKAAARELGVGIRWGGDFKSFYDGPHFELTS